MPSFVNSSVGSEIIALSKSRFWTKPSVNLFNFDLFNSTLDDEEIEKYLDNIDKRLVVFVSTYTDEGKANTEKEKMESMSTGLERHFDRLKTGKIIDDYDIYPSSDFEDFLLTESLITFNF